MSRRTQLFQLIPWVGGINTSVDPGVLNPQELVQADNVVFSSTGARIKREAFEYLDHEIFAPDFKSSSGTTRNITWTTTALINIVNLDQRLVVGEKITITGDANYAVVGGTVLSVNEIHEVTSVTTVADVAGSLAGKYFLISAGDSGVDYYVWYKVSGVGTDPTLIGKTGIEVDISTNDSANTIASATQAIIDAHVSFSATVSTNVVTVTADLGGLTKDADAGTSGFTVVVMTQGGHSITYTGGSSLTQSSTAATGLSLARASSVISETDYWRWTGQGNEQLLIIATDNFQLFKIDNDGRRVQIFGQPEVQVIQVTAASAITGGHYFLLSAANNSPNYYVWYKKGGVGSDPVVINRTGVEVDIGATDTDAQVATATAAAIDALLNFSASAATNVVTITNVIAGITDQATDFNSGFTFAILTYGATNPAAPVETIRTMVFNERLLMFFSGLGNKPIAYNPEESATYVILDPTAPDASFGFEFLQRVWTNQKDDQDRLNYSETFDETLWQGFGDSGALDVGPGDGDPEGINNAYKYKGLIIVGKKARRYRISGDSPENFFPEIITEGLGNEGTFSIPVDESDVIFMSRRGVHSQSVTDAYGDTVANYVSKKIKPTFNNFQPFRLKYSQGTFLPELNSIAISIADQGSSTENTVWLYNIQAELPGGERGAWYRWPNVSCQSLSRRLVNGKYKAIFGTSAGRVVQAQHENNFADFGTDGIKYLIKTGTIYVDQNPQTMKGYKKVTLFYHPQGSFSFTVSIKIDNFPSQSFSFTQTSGDDLLGINFILGSSRLGSSNVLAPFSFSMDGKGRGITVTISQPTADEQIEVWGIGIEYEQEDIVQETV